MYTQSPVCTWLMEIFCWIAVLADTPAFLSGYTWQPSIIYPAGKLVWLHACMTMMRRTNCQPLLVLFLHSTKDYNHYRLHTSTTNWTQTCILSLLNIYQRIQLCEWSKVLQPWPKLDVPIGACIHKLLMTVQIHHWPCICHCTNKVLDYWSFRTKLPTS